MYYGIGIDGGKATLIGVNLNGSDIGVHITSTAEVESGAVTITGSKISAGYHALLIESNVKDAYIHVKEISGCEFTATEWSDSPAVKLEDSTNNGSILVESMKNCKLFSPTTALQAKGKQTDDGNSVVINEMVGCSLFADNSYSNSTGTPDAPYGINLEQYATISGMSGCQVVAASASTSAARTVSVGNGCALNLIFAANTNNYFGASGSTTYLFSGDGITGITMNGEQFDESKNVTTQTENREGYACHKLQSV